MDNVLIRPPVPLWHEIPSGLQIGKMVEIRGTVPYGADLFQVNFLPERDSGSHEGRRIFHMSVRFPIQTVVRNAKLDSTWGEEERNGPFPFCSGKSFVILILVEAMHLKVAVDGQHCFEFRHRWDISSAKFLYVDGSIRLDEVQYYMSPAAPGTCATLPATCATPPDACVQLPNPPSQTIYNPTIPFTYPFPGGLTHGMNIFIQGRPSASVSRFSINLQCGRGPYPPPDIAFHFDVRHYNYTIVRNTRLDNQWGTEEVLTPEFPFQPAVNFDLIIRVEQDGFVVTVNGKLHTRYRHRLFPLSRVNTLCIEDDIVVSSIRFQ